MSKVVALGRTQTISEECIKAVEDFCDMARKGEVTELVLIVRHVETGYDKVLSFDDTMRLMGFLSMMLITTERVARKDWQE
jgi:hypothetical protein